MNKISPPPSLPAHPALAKAATSDPVVEFNKLAGAYTDAKYLTELLAWLRENSHLITPSMTCGRIPEGCSVALAVEWVDVEHECYPQKGKDGEPQRYALGQGALRRIGNAAGVQIDPTRSGRVDDATDARYCHWHSEGLWPQLDGSLLPLPPGDREIDLRDESDQVATIFNDARDDGAAEWSLRNQRANIVSNAQTKSELRVIRRGLRIRAYTLDELMLPFTVVRLVWDGRSDDPAIRRDNAKAIRERFLPSRAALYGGPSERPKLVIRADASPMGIHAPPPVGDVKDSDDEDEGSHGPEPEPTPPPPRRAPPPAPPSEETSAKRRDEPPAPIPTSSPRRRWVPPKQHSTASGPMVFKYGRWKGFACDDPTVPIGELAWYRDEAKAQIADPSKSKYRRNNEASVAALDREIARRKTSSSNDPYVAIDGCGDGDDIIPY